MSSATIRIGRVCDSLTPGATWSVGILAIALIGVLDYATGTELRVFPIYYAPIMLLSWNVGRRGTVAGAFLSALAWLGGNHFAGRRYSSDIIWAANTLVLAASFGIVGFLLTTLKAALTRERSLSRTDPLTSLLNSRAFYEEGGRILGLCRRKNHPIAMAYLDLDNFKAVNDRSGHEAGDEMLRRVADILRVSTRPSDLCARLGGDEFAILLPEADAGEATMALERLRLLVSERLASATIPVTCSLGAVVFPKAPEHMEEMISAADRRMYVAKTAGKNQIHLVVADG